MAIVEPRPPLELPEPEGLDMRSLLRAMWRDRVRIAAGTVLAAVLTFGVALLLPKSYTATAVILPPEESDLLSNMSLAQRALSKFPRFGILDDYFTPADIYKAILVSRTVQEAVVTEFDLRRVYGRPSLEKAIRAFKDHARVRLNPDGTIAVSVEDRDPKRAAAIANRLLALLDRTNLTKRNTQARRTREFLEHRVAETDSLLRVSETALKRYQESSKTVAPASAGGADVRAAADLMSRKMALEVRLGMLRGYLQDDNEQIVQTRLELAQLNARIAELPRVQNELVRLTRDAKIQEGLYLLLTSELEQARIRETMDTPTVQVLDPAVPPERHTKPKRLLLAGAAAVIALALQVAWLAVRERPGAHAHS